MSRSAYKQAELKIERALRSGANKLNLSEGRGEKLTELPESIGSLVGLQSLNLSGNQLTTLPKSLGALRQLVSLDLSANDLTELPAVLGELTELRWLRLFRNHLTSLEGPLERLEKLEELDLHGNKLKALSAQVAKLTRLKSLVLIDNEFSIFPKEIGYLTQLQSLNISGNNLTEVPALVGQLSKLETLWLYGNKLTSVSTELGALSQLRKLSLGRNLLEVLPDSIGRLVELTLLILEKNLLESLPLSLSNLPKLERLFLGGNDKLRLPPEVVGCDYAESLHDAGEKQPAVPSKILDYYFRTRRGKRPLNEAKLILVGRGGVGKTSLINRLVHGNFNEHEQETPGIEIQPWEVILSDNDCVRLHVWDFGGQEILHATHQFFLTERTVYLLVLSGREGTATHDAEYWLQLIRSFGGDSPVVIALNKSYQFPFDVNRGLLLEKYPQIAAFVRTDCQRAANGSMAGIGFDAVGIEELHQLIIGATANMEHRKVDFPADWFSIKERLAGMEENFLTWDRYQEICRELGEKSIEAQRDLADFLHILGIALNYRGDPRLRETHVLNPRWVTEGIYSILRFGQKKKKEREGVIEFPDLVEALNPRDYPVSSHEFLLALMERFHLCFEMPGGYRRYLAPELLGENQPDEIKHLLATPGLGFRYQYEVLPEGLLPRFIVQTHVHSETNPNWRWRTGVVLNREGCRAVVRADVRERRVDIHIAGPERQRRDLLAIVRERFAEYHRDLKGLTVDQRVPVTGESGVTVSYEFLLTLEDEDEQWVRPEGARQKHRVADLLNGIESPEQRLSKTHRSKTNEKPMGKKHVFLSYCRDNFNEAELLRDDLIAAGEVVWWDQEILPGYDWKLAIDQAMANSYAVVLCLSKETEMRTTSGIYPEAASAIGALREYRPDSVFLIPVRFSECPVPPLEIDSTRRLDRIQYVDLFPGAKRAKNLKKLIAAIQAAPNHP